MPATGEDNPNTFLTGCISRACDVAPFVACDADLYDQLRLDFPATPYLDSSINLRDSRVDRLDKDGNKVQRNNPGRVDKKIIELLLLELM